MKRRWRILLATPVFLWIAGIAPAWVYLPWFHDPLAGPGDNTNSWALYYTMAPLILVLAGCLVLVVGVPLACLVSWAFGKSDEENREEWDRTRTPKERYARGEITLEELQYLTNQEILAEDYRK